jgi:hypothetical protein
MRGIAAWAAGTGLSVSLVLVPALAGAATNGPATGVRTAQAGRAVTGPGAGTPAPAPRQGPSPASSDPDTTVTFTVTTGALTITAPTAANLGSGPESSVISGNLGTVTVDDERDQLTASWVATASSTDFTTGGGSPAETIPVSAATYNPGTITTIGTITATGSVITLSGVAQTVVAGTAGSGDNEAIWNPIVAVTIPGTVIGGVYTGTLTHSVA